MREIVDTLERVQQFDLVCLNFLREYGSVLETQVKKRRKRDKPRPRILTFNEHMATTTEADFRSLYRLHLEDFNTLHDEIILSCPEFAQPRSPVENKVRLLSTLRYLAGGSPLDAARNYGMARPTFDNHLQINLRCIIKVEMEKHRYNFNDAAQLEQIEKKLLYRCSRSRTRAISQVYWLYRWHYHFHKKAELQKSRQSTRFLLRPEKDVRYQCHGSV